MPDIISAFGAINNPLKKSELARQSPSTGNDKYAITTVTAACDGVPITFEKAYAVASGFNTLEGRTAEHIVSAVFLLKEHNALFTEEALAGHGFCLVRTTLGLHAKTLRNLQLGGRITAHVAKTFLEGAQAAYAEVFAGQSDVPDKVAQFLACSDLRDYVTTNTKAGHTAVLQDENGDYLCASEDLISAPEGWSDWT